MTAPNVFNYMDPRGRPRTAKSSAAVPGQAGYESAPLVTDPVTGRTRTPQGDAFNAFRGYVGPQGGGFGGFGSEYGPYARTMAQIAGYREGGDRAGIEAGLAATDPRVRAAAQSYDLGFGSQGLPEGGDYTALKAAQTARTEAQAANQRGDRLSREQFNALHGQTTDELWDRSQARGPDAPTTAPSVDADPFGRFDAPTAANRVITPASEARLRTQRETNMALPNEALTDPFAPFQSPRQMVPGAPGAELFGGQPMNAAGVRGGGAIPAPTFPTSGSAFLSPEEIPPPPEERHQEPAPPPGFPQRPFPAPVPFAAGANVAGGMAAGLRRVGGRGGRSANPLQRFRPVRPRPEDQVAGPASSLAAY